MIVIQNRIMWDLQSYKCDDYIICNYWKLLNKFHFDFTDNFEFKGNCY